MEKDHTLKSKLNKGSASEEKFNGEKDTAPGENIDNIENIKSFKKDNTKFNRFIKLLPLTCNLNNFGVLLNDNYLNNENKLGKLYKYSHDIIINIYDELNNSYSGIVFKKEYEYFRFKDIFIEASHKNNFKRII